MRDRAHERLRRDESGAYATLFIIVLVVFVGLSALVVDLASLYFTRHQAKAVADMAATAAALALEPTADGNPQKGCEAAWTYVVLNLPDVDTNDAPSPYPCSGFPPTCDPTQATHLDGQILDGGEVKYTITVTWPVPEDEPIMDQRETPQIDGESCQRIGVDVRRARPMVFAGFGGGPSDVTMGGGSVSRYQSSTDDGDIVALVILERHECRALLSTGQGAVTVKAVEVNEFDNAGNVINTFWAPGAITVDSDGNADGNGPSCTTGGTGTRYTAAVSGNNVNSWLKAEATPDGLSGVFLTHAAQVGGASHAPPPRCGPEGSATDTTPVQPCPAGGNRVKREPIDHRYNCKASYPVEFDINPCENAAAGGNYIDQLVAAYAGTGTPSTGAFNGDPFDVYPRDPALFPNDTCNFQNTTPPVTLADGNWFIDCPNIGNQQGFRMNGSSFTVGAGELVFAGGIDIGSDAQFTAGNLSDDTLMYLRTGASNDGNLEKGAQGRLTLLNTFVYLEDGVIEVGAGSPPLTWIAPVDDDFPFDDLSLWSENDDQHLLGGQGTLDIEGTFFTPNARPFNFNGQGSQHQTKAQFVTRRLTLSGQAELVMEPDPDRITLFPISGVKLIR